MRRSATFERMLDWHYVWRWRHPLNRLYDRRYGVETEELVELSDLDLQGEDRVWYQPSEWRSVRRTLRRLDVDREDVLLDFGSGKGRVLLIAAGFPFRR